MILRSSFCIFDIQLGVHVARDQAVIFILRRLSSDTAFFFWSQHDCTIDSRDMLLRKDCPCNLALLRCSRPALQYTLLYWQRTHIPGNLWPSTPLAMMHDSLACFVAVVLLWGEGLSLVGSLGHCSANFPGHFARIPQCPRIISKMFVSLYHQCPRNFWDLRGFGVKI